MENNSKTKNLIIIFVLLILLLVIPFTLYLTGQRQEIRKKAGEFPQTVVFVPNVIKAAKDEEFTLTLLLRKAALKNQKLDAADIIFRYFNTEMELKMTGNKVVNISSSFPSGLDVSKNEVSTNSALNTIAVTFHTTGQRNSYIPESDLVIGTVTFKALEPGVHYLWFDTDRTVVAGGGINNSNFSLGEESALVRVQSPTVFISRVFPSMKNVGYESFDLSIYGSGYATTQKVKIGDVDCGNVQVFEAGKKITCTVPAGLSVGYRGINILNSEDKSLAREDKIFSIVETLTPIVNLKVRFSGVIKISDDLLPVYGVQRAKIRVVGNGVNFEKDNVILTATTSGNLTIFQTRNDSFADDRIPLFSTDSTGLWFSYPFVPGNYDLYVKGPKHIQKKFSVNITARENNVERLTVESALPGGDLPLDITHGQDGRVNSFDYNFYVNHWQEFDSLARSNKPEDIERYKAYLEIADLNYDGGIDGGDTSVIADTLGELKDEDE